MPKPPVTDTPHRPLSPHLQVWRFHITMATSILHRATGVATIAGLLLGVWWLVALGSSAEAYATYLGFAASPFGLLIWFGVTLSGFVHLTGGIRHLIWDIGLGFDLKSANALSWSGLLIGIALTVILWVYLFASGKVVL